MLNKLGAKGKVDKHDPRGCE